MKDDIIMYGVCAAISIAAVAITSIVKLIVCSIAKKRKKDVSSNAKEYLFTPIALVLSAIGVYIWLDRFVRLENDERFILIVACFSIGTMLVYWLLFQPTRKLAKAIIRAIVNKSKLKPAVDAVEQIIVNSSTEYNKTDLQSTAKPLAGSEADKSAESLREMVESIKNK